MFKKLLLLVTVMVAALLGTPAVAQAGTCTLIFCGEIGVRTNSQTALRVTYNFGDPYSADKVVYQGHSSAEYGKDTDGFHVETGRNVTCIFSSRDVRSYSATGWYKITDLEHPDCIQFYQ